MGRRVFAARCVFSALETSPNSAKLRQMCDAGKGLMKRLLTTLAVSGLLATRAFAADMPVKAPPPAAPIIHSWSGLYVGANVGGSWSNSDPRYSIPPFTDPGGGIFAVCGTPPGVALPVPTSPNPFDLSTQCRDDDSAICALR